LWANVLYEAYSTDLNRKLSEKKEETKKERKKENKNEKASRLTKLMPTGGISKQYNLQRMTLNYKSAQE